MAYWGTVMAVLYSSGELAGMLRACLGWSLVGPCAEAGEEEFAPSNFFFSLC